MVLDWIGGLGAWTWIILGVVLIGLELVAPGAFLLCLGLAAILTGLIDGWASLSWQIATLTFAGLSVVSVLVGRGVNRAPQTGEAATLNRRGEGLTGRVFTLEAPIVAGEGRVRIDDSSWRILGPDTPAGARVRVTRVDGATLIVETT
jgi:membrane protein implicated in regulation of membrane protease activity